jgi:hypothetical protein
VVHTQTVPATSVCSGGGGRAGQGRAAASKETCVHVCRGGRAGRRQEAANTGWLVLNRQCAGVLGGRGGQNSSSSSLKKHLCVVVH